MDSRVLESLSISSSPTLGSTEPEPSSEIFKYEPLDLSIDSIRLLVLLPGKLGDEIECELVHRTFASKPKYEALSYTWGDPSNQKSICLNGSKFKVRVNLSNALTHIRSEHERRFLWVDAICIDQSNLEERNCQVTLMAFIYTRAQVVLVWLGIPKNLSPEIDPLLHIDFMISLPKNPYCHRLWIMQEVGLSRSVKFCFGTRTFVWEEFQSRLSSGIDGGTRRRWLNLMELRDKRHGEDGCLEMLLEKFEDAQCEEVRDKVYGLLGLANDCQDAPLQVDYSAPLRQIYADVIRFQNSARPLGEGYWHNHPDLDRPVRLVRFSQIVQRAFGGQVDLSPNTNVPQEDSSQILHATGYIASTILYVGPTYGDTISSFNATRIWKASLDKYYTDAHELRNLRKLDEEYTVRLPDMEEEDLARVCSIRSSKSFGFREKEPESAAQCEDQDVVPQEFQKSTCRRDISSSSELRRFLGSSKGIGLVPPTAQEGDLICKFWKCNVAIILRTNSTTADRFEIIGRANFCELKDVAAVEHNVRAALVGADNTPYRHVNFRLDIDTLQNITC